MFQIAWRPTHDQTVHWLHIAECPDQRLGITINEDTYPFYDPVSGAAQVDEDGVSLSLVLYLMTADDDATLVICLYEHGH